MCPFSFLAFLQPSTVDKEARKKGSIIFVVGKSPIDIMEPIFV